MARTIYQDVTGLTTDEISAGVVILKDGTKSSVKPSKKNTSMNRENGTKSTRSASPYSPTRMNQQFAESELALQQRFAEQARGEMAAPNKYSQRYNYETYQYDYYCGSQVKVFFGDIWVDDVVTIQYSIKQGKEPIYSYASQYFDAVAMGNVLGDGVLVIAFKEVGYFNVIRAYLEEQRLGTERINKNGKHVGKSGAQIASENIAARLSKVYSTDSAQDIANSLKSTGNISPGLVRQSETIENVLDNLHASNLQVERSVGTGKNGSRVVQNNNVDFNSGKYRTKDFEDAAEVLEDLIWGDSNGQVIGLGKEHQLLRADEFDYIKNGKGESVGIKSAFGTNYEEVFNILLTFGDISDKRAEHTLTMLNDVHFTGHSVVISPTGEPIGEAYNFFFRDINKTVNTNNVKINPLALRLSNNEMFQLSSMQDMENLLDPYIGAFPIIEIKSYYDGTKWVNYQQQLDLLSMNMETFNINKVIGTNQSLINYVEQAINEMYFSGTVVPDPSLNMEKFAISVRLKYGIDNGGVDANVNSETSINLLAERVGDIGHQYRITMPNKNPGQILDVIRREDFFSPVPEKKDTPFPKANNVAKTNLSETPNGTVAVEQNQLIIDSNTTKAEVTDLTTKDTDINSEVADLKRLQTATNEKILGTNLELTEKQQKQLDKNDKEYQKVLQESIKDLVDLGYSKEDAIWMINNPDKNIDEYLGQLNNTTAASTASLFYVDNSNSLEKPSTESVAEKQLTEQQKQEAVKTIKDPTKRITTVPQVTRPVAVQKTIVTVTDDKNQFVTDIISAVSKYESSTAGGYNAVYSGSVKAFNKLTDKKVTELTLGELIPIQRTLIKQTGHSPVGAGQFTKYTIEGWMKSENIPKSRKFDEKAQQEMFKWLILETAGGNKYFSGKQSFDLLTNRLSNIWEVIDNGQVVIKKQ